MDYSCDVSVRCLVYNHEKYLRQCLDGFVMQKGVRFEVIIHDDASTDGSADIIREYERKYPEIFKPIYQTENQYSQGKSVTELISSKLTGKYTAFCEGDDYWADPYKLNKQFDALEKNIDCVLSTHLVKMVSERGDFIGSRIPEEKIESGIIPGIKLIETIQYLFQTSSYFIRTECYKDFLNQQFRKISPVGDVPILLYCGAIGNVYYFEEEMSCYRCGTPGSWTQMVSGNDERMCNYGRKMIAVCNAFQEFTQFRYKQIMDKRVLFYKHFIYERNRSKKELFDEDYFRSIRTYSFRQKIGIILFDLFPSFKNWYIRFWEKK